MIKMNMKEMRMRKKEMRIIMVGKRGPWQGKRDDNDDDDDDEVRGGPLFTYGYNIRTNKTLARSEAVNSVPTIFLFRRAENTTLLRN